MSISHRLKKTLLRVRVRVFASQQKGPNIPFSSARDGPETIEDYNFCLLIVDNEGIAQ